jgi:hypothetical protein
MRKLTVSQRVTMNNVQEVRYKKIFWLSILLSLLISPIWFYLMKFAPGQVKTMQPVQLFFLIWIISLLFSFIFCVCWYSGEVMVKPHKKGVYYRCVLGLLAFMVASAFFIKSWIF